MHYVVEFNGVSIINFIVKLLELNIIPYDKHIRYLCNITLHLKK